MATLLRILRKIWAWPHRGALVEVAFIVAGVVLVALVFFLMGD